MKTLLSFFLTCTFVNTCFPQNFISKENIIKNIQTLGSDEFKGRGTGEPGGEKAAQYLADEFGKFNLKPLGENGTYFQNIRMHGGKPLVSSELIIHSSEEQIKFELWKDYLIYFSGEQAFIPAPIELVFAGYGIIAPEYDYNDYQTIDVEGKIAVFLYGEPFSDDESYFDGEKQTIHSYPDIKQKIALSRGARGSILIPDMSGGIYSGWENLKREFSFEDVTLAYSVTNSLALIINPNKADLLFSNSELNLALLFDLHKKGNMQSFDMNISLSFRGEFKERDFIAANVIGLAEGSNPKLKNEYILISAHYDHLGTGNPVNGDSIYNGVFDNAAGISALLELARIFSSELNPQRSIIFLLVTGEEKGLLGSLYYTDNPVVPLYKTAANINIDGIALFDKFKSIIGIGSEHSTIKDFLIITAAGNNVKLTDLPDGFINYEAFSRSDQAAFANAGIPSLLILDAPDYFNLSEKESLKKFIHYSENIYHTPFDDLNQEMNFDAAVQHMDIILDLCYLLSVSEETPEWDDNSPYLNERLRTIAEKK